MSAKKVPQHLQAYADIAKRAYETKTMYVHEVPGHTSVRNVDVSPISSAEIEAQQLAWAHMSNEEAEVLYDQQLSKRGISLNEARLIRTTSRLPDVIERFVLGLDVTLNNKARRT